MVKIRCKKCEKETEHSHMHDSPYGLPGAHMSNTERYECQECGRGIYAYEGKEQGLEYYYD